MLLHTLKSVSRSFNQKGFSLSFKQFNIATNIRNSSKSFNLSPLQTARSYSNANANTNTIKSLSLFIGAAGALYTTSNFKILNDSATTHANLGTINLNNIPSLQVDPPQVKTTSRFNGKLHYKQLTYGSFAGLVLGVIIGKLSTALVFISLSTFLFTQFLENRGIITVPWTSIIKIGSDRVDVKKLVFEDPSFKISFVLSFLIAAFNV